MLRRRCARRAAWSVRLSPRVVSPYASRRLRILWLNHFLPYPPTGGALQRTHHLLREAARQHEIHLVALNQRAILPTARAVAEGVEYLKHFCAKVEVFPMTWDASSWRRVMVRAGSFFIPS